jgi:hypothetical protein
VNAFKLDAANLGVGLDFARQEETLPFESINNLKQKYSIF